MFKIPKSDITLFPLFFAGALLFFTVFVKGIPIITTINEKVGGDKYEPSGRAIVVEGTMFVIRSVVKFFVLNYGCALSDHVGRKPIAVLFILPNVVMDLMLIFAEVNESTIYSMGSLWGLTSVTIPTLRAWVCDICAQDPVEMVNAQGAFRGFTIGPATIVGIPLGTMFALYSNPKYAFICSLIANIIAILVCCLTTLDDTRGIARRLDTVREKQLSTNMEMTHAQGATISPLVSANSSPSSTSIQTYSTTEPSRPARSLPGDGLKMFAWTHAPWMGFELIYELSLKNPSSIYLWAAYFLSYCANEVPPPVSSPSTLPALP
jgi:hypothetical protein